MNFLYLGENGFPFRFAAVQRQKLISKALVYKGDKVLVLCRKGIHDKKNIHKISRKGSFEGIEYKYCSGTAYYPESFIIRTVLKIIGFFVESLHILYMGFFKNYNYAIVSTFSYKDFRVYHFLCRISGVKIILDCVESYTNMDGRKKFIKNDKLFEKKAYRMSDRIFFISEFLKNQIEKKGGKHMLKVPVICDFEKFIAKTKKISDEKYFLFCGSAIYAETIEFIVNSFNYLNNEMYFLYLLVNGEQELIKNIESIVEQSPKKALIKILSPVTEAKLIQLYKSAEALLIPIRPTKQDEARFPHKIGEYLASCRPIITTNFGEIRHYFVDSETALIAESYDPKHFAKKMKIVISDPDLTERIALAGHQMGLKNFDYKETANKLNDFFAK